MTPPIETIHKRPLLARRVIEEACRLSEITVREFKSPGRARYLTHARFAVSYVLRKRRPDLSYPQIGWMLGRRDHSTVIHGVERAKALLDTDPDFKYMVQELEALN